MQGRNFRDHKMSVSMNNGRNWGYRIRSVLLYIRECEMREKKKKETDQKDEEHDLCTRKYGLNRMTDGGTVLPRIVRFCGMLGFAVYSLIKLQKSNPSSFPSTHPEKQFCADFCKFS